MTLTKLLDYLPRGNLLDDEAWHKRHVFLMWVLGLHIPPLVILGLELGWSTEFVLSVLAVPTVFVLVATQVRHRRVASFFVTAGLTWCSVALVVFSRGSIEAHFHFFIIIGFIALYQDWVPFLWDIVFTTISHGVGSIWIPDLIFNHISGQNNPWLWSVIHGVSVLGACVGLVVFWRETENEQQKTLTLRTELANAEITQRKFTSDLLVNLARRNQSMLYRQLDIIGQLEEKERDPDALAELFRLDHLATRIRRNAESLLVLSGEEPTRVWGEPVRLIDVVRAAIAETEDLDRVAFAVDERMEVLGHLVTDLTHVLAELTENAVRFSPPEANVTIRTRPYMRKPGAAVLTVEDWGVGMRPEDMAAANDTLANPRDVDLAVSQRLGLHVVARLAARHNIQVTLTATPGCGVTAAVVLPAELFAEGPRSSGDQRGNGRTAVDHSVQASRPAPAPVAAGPSTAGPSAGHDIPMPRRGQANARRDPATPGPADHHNYYAAPSSRRPSGNGSGDAGARPGPTNGSARAHGAGPTSGDGHGAASNGHRGVHATPPNAEHASDGGATRGEWTGWWTPSRLPTVDAEGWEEAEPVYVTAEREQPEPHHGWTPPPAPALPAGTTRSRRPEQDTGPVITARTNGGATGQTNGSHPNGSHPNGRKADESGTSTAAENDAAAAGPRLTRRVPQAHLARELRRDGEHDDVALPEQAPPADAERARDALSRFQASRQAAQQEMGTSQNDRRDAGGGRS